MRTAERKHYLDLLNEHKSNLKKAWQILKMVINKRKYTPICTKFQTNGKVVSDGHEISNKFNRFFVNVGSTLANAFPPTNKKPSEYITSNKVLFVMSSVTENEIEKLIENLKESSCGWDELRPRIMKFIKQSIKIPLTHVSNVIPNRGISSWTKNCKCGTNIHIWWWNNFDKLQTSISLTSFFSKILIRLMYNRLIEFINENGLLYKYQFGFQKGKSTSMALVTLIDKITEALDKGECIIGVFLDFYKALTQLIMAYYYKNWNYMVYKISHSYGLKIIYQIEFST